MGAYHSFEKNETATMLFLKKPSLVWWVEIPFVIREAFKEFRRWTHSHICWPVITLEADLLIYQ